MNKQEFLDRLATGLSGLPGEDVAERLGFYGEMIDDLMEEGNSEEEALAKIGSVELIVAQIIAETPITKIVKEKIRRRRRPGAWEIVLLVLGFPLWFSLLIAAFAVILSVYVSLWAIVISLWAVFVSLAASAFGCFAAAAFILLKVSVLAALALVGACFVCAGLAIFAFYGCKAVTKGLVKLTGKMLIGTKNMFAAKEEV